MLLSYIVTGVKSQFMLTIGKCYCQFVIGGRCYCQLVMIGKYSI